MLEVLPGLISALLWLVVPVVIFVGRHWIMARVRRGVEHQFDIQIEEIRTKLHQTEEQFKSELRDKEAEITALRNTILAGSASRQALLDKRRFEAVEKVWTAINDFKQLKALSSMMAVMKFDAVAKEVGDPRIQKFLEVIGTSAPDMQKFKNAARDERPFLPEPAWAYFAAYTQILYANFARFTILKGGWENPQRIFNSESLKAILKATLPHQSKYIDENDPGTYHYLLDEIEERLLVELRKILEAQEADKAATDRAKAIMDALREAEEKQTAEQVATLR
jgi:hypothetical protein